MLCYAMLCCNELSLVELICAILPNAVHGVKPCFSGQVSLLVPHMRLAGRVPGYGRV